MNKEALLKTTEIVSHAACPDGIGSAMMCVAAFAHLELKPPPVNFVQYGTYSHNNVIPKPGQLFVDITPPRSRWEEWRGLSPIVFDHHETVKNVVQELNGVYGGPDHSGTMLAFEHVLMEMAGERIPEEDLSAWKRFAHLCMVRDTWKSASEDWADACSLAHALLLHGQRECVDMAQTGRVPLEYLLSVGFLTHQKIMRQAKGVAKNSLVKNLTVGNKPVKAIFFNHADGGSVSDIAHFVMEQAPCNAVIAYFFNQDKDKFRCVCSVRTDGSFLASELAQYFGGGGHSKAAGFTVDGNQSPLGVIETIVQTVESHLK